MIVTYIDSSAFLRLIMNQGNVSAVEHALGANPTSSTLAGLEIRAAIFKQWHDGQILEEERDTLLAVSEQRILANLALLDLSPETLSEAGNVVERHSLRTLDALHVATAIRANRYLRRRGARLDFVSADRRQSEAAREIFGTGTVTFVPPSH
ncbi:MAG: type II toxin-antitoxin system VapC family toxin [Chloroflexota bacterium]